MKEDGQWNNRISIQAKGDAQGFKQESRVLGSAGWKWYGENMNKIIWGEGSGTIPKLEKIPLDICLKFHVFTSGQRQETTCETEICVVGPISKHFHAEHKHSRKKLFQRCLYMSFLLEVTSDFTS